MSHLGKRKIIFKMPFLGDMLIPWRVSFWEGLYSGAMLVAGEGIPRHIPPPFIALHLSSPASSIFALRLTLQFRGRPVGQIGDRVGLTTAGRTIS